MNPRRIRTLGRYEMTLFWRNRTAVFMSLALPLAAAGFIATANADRRTNAVMITAMTGVGLVLIVYYNLVTVYVARREERVLKRLRAGEATDSEILLGAAVPPAAIAAGQGVLLTAAGSVFLGLPVPVNAPVLAAGLLGGIAMFTLLAAASSAFTRTVELAQLTTLPVTIVCFAGSGLILPVDAFPDPMATIARFLPLTPVVDLMRLGWVGGTVTGGLPAAGAVLAGWIAISGVAAWRLFRWEPRQ